MGAFGRIENGHVYHAYEIVPEEFTTWWFRVKCHLRKIPLERRIELHKKSYHEGIGHSGGLFQGVTDKAFAEVRLNDGCITTRIQTKPFKTSWYIVRSVPCTEATFNAAVAQALGEFSDKNHQLLEELFAKEEEPVAVNPA